MSLIAARRLEVLMKPLSVATEGSRLGKKVVRKADWDDGEFNLMQSGWRNPTMRQFGTQKQTIKAIVEWVAGLPPLKMHHRAAWERAQHPSTERFEDPT